MSRMTHIFKGSIRKKVENKNWEFLKRNIIEKKKKEISEDNQPIAFMESTCIVAFNAEKKVKHKHGNRAKPDGRADNYNNNKGGRLP